MLVSGGFGLFFVACFCLFVWVGFGVVFLFPQQPYKNETQEKIKLLNKSLEMCSALNIPPIHEVHTHHG